MTQAYSVEH